MTSKLSRDRLQEIAEDGFLKYGESKELARMALAAMDSSESVEMPLDYLQGHKDGLEWAAQLAEANHPETGDWLYDDPIELAKAIRKGPDMPPAQPVADSEPDRNPVLAYADSYRDMAKQGVESVPIWSVITDIERNIAPLYRHAQPAPVVPAVSDDIGEIRVGRLPTMNQDDYPGLGDWWVQLRIGEDSDEVLARVYGATPQEANNRAEALACRAAMLQSGNSPAQSNCCPAQNHVSPEQNGDTPAQNQGWIPVSEQMPEREVDVQVYCPDKKEQMVAYLERNELEGYFRFATWRTGEGIYCQPTHWMQLPAGPREVKGE
ncbi:DUF551 domain-containing protein [Klebsiella pneumoniae]